MTVRWLLADDGSLEILLYEDIGKGASTLGAVSKLLRDNANAKNITVRISSLGGSFHEGLSIYNLLAQHRAHVTCIVDGIAASAASLIAMAGDDILMARGTEMNVHGVQMKGGAAEGSVEELRRAADDLALNIERSDAMNADIARIYASRSGLPEARVLEIMRADTVMSADEAVTLGFATKVIEPMPIAAKARSMFLAADGDEPVVEPGAEPAKTEPPPADGDKSAEPGKAVDFNAYGEALASNSGFDKATVLAYLMEAQDAILEMLTRMGETPGAQGQKVRRMRALEVTMAGDKTVALEAKVAKLEAEAEKRAADDAEAWVAAKVEGGYVRPERRALAMKLYRNDPGEAEQLFSEKVVPVGDEQGTPPKGDKGAVLEMKDLTDAERLSVKGMVWMSQQEAIKKVVSRRKEN